MRRVLDILLNNGNDAFRFYSKVFLFGSSLTVPHPNDIDILLVYEDTDLTRVSTEKNRTAELLRLSLGDYVLDFTTLSQTEFEQTGFLFEVLHSKIKG